MPGVVFSAEKLIGVMKISKNTQKRRLQRFGHVVSKDENFFPKNKQDADGRSREAREEIHEGDTADRKILEFIIKNSIPYLNYKKLKICEV